MTTGSNGGGTPPGGRHAYDDTSSTYRYGEGFKQLPTITAEFKQQLAALAAQAEHHPTSQAVKDRLAAMVEAAHRLEEASAEVYPTYRSTMPEVHRRVEQPHGGNIHVESRADAGRAMRDQ